MNKLVLYLFLSLTFGCSSFQKEHIRINASAEKSIYCGCLIFMDDIYKTEELSYALQFQPNTLLRSWYRWGEPTNAKQYSKRKHIVDQALSQGVSVGGGASLSFVNDGDLARHDFDRAWLSVDLSGNAINKNGKKFATLSAPGFRNYLIKNIIEQVQLGIKEIHLGESNGEIHFDDWSLGLKGDSGFIQWVKNKYIGKGQNWWIQQFGSLGEKISQSKDVERNDFIKLTGSFLENFKSEWGKEGSWEGLNKVGDSAFLTYLYLQNLDSFLKELKHDLKSAGFSDISVDVWGFAKWMPLMTNQPDAYISSPPDERWGLNWAGDANFDLKKSRDRIRGIMAEQVKSVKPVPVIYLIDHPKPFEDFKKLSDEKQSEITEYFASLTQELGANFVFRAYGNEQSFLGAKTNDIIKSNCLKRKPNYCPVGL